MSAVRWAGESESCVLPVVRDANAATVSELRPGGGSGMVDMPALRSGIVLTSTADRLVASAMENQRCLGPDTIPWSERWHSGYLAVAGRRRVTCMT